MKGSIMKPLYCTLNDASKECGKSIEQLLIMGETGQIALCVRLSDGSNHHSPYSNPYSGTIDIDDDTFNSLPDETEDKFFSNFLSHTADNIEKAERQEAHRTALLADSPKKHLSGKASNKWRQISDSKSRERGKREDRGHLWQNLSQKGQNWKRAPWLMPWHS